MAEPTADLSNLEARALAELNAATDEAGLQAWNTRLFGDKGELTAALKALGTLPKDQRAAYGQAVNRVKQNLLAAEEQKKAAIKEEKLLASLSAAPLDVTLPGRPVPAGGVHLATKVMREIYAIFADMGFQVFRSREVEDDQTNFELLNMPPHHPARDMWDTFHTTTPGVLYGPTPRRGRSTSCGSRPPTRCGSSCRACATATSRSPRGARSSSSRSRGWRSARASRWPT